MNRLALAHWLVDRRHPLTARVVVNRLWEQVFGLGIVESSENLGVQTDWPSHPELLDWLAVDFVEHGWNIKRLLKKMVMSATYRQTASVDPDGLIRDPKNQLLSRGPLRAGSGPPEPPPRAPARRARARPPPRPHPRRRC